VPGDTIVYMHEKWSTIDDDTWDEGAQATFEPVLGSSPPAEADVIPPGLDTWEPGPVLAAILSSIDVASLTGHDRVVVLQAHQRLASHHQGECLRAMSAIADAYRDELGVVEEEWAWEAAEAEVRAALRLTRRAASSDMTLAHDLHHRLPEVARALTDGQIDLRRARVFVHETGHLPEDVARTVVSRVLDRAGGWTTGQLAARLRRLALAIDPEGARARLETSVDRRRVVVEPTADGTADLVIADVSPDQAMRASDHVERLARHLRARDGETRTLDQLRADVAVDLLSGARPASARSRPMAARGRADIRVDLATLARLTEEPGDLAGFGPVVAEIARQTALAARSWAFTVTDPDSGEVFATGVTRRRPTAAQARRVMAEQPICTFPGCLMPARSCDLDHRIPYSEGGPTSVDHLAPVCRHDHGIRHRFGWTHRPGQNRRLIWKSPLGHEYEGGGEPP
jgi:hypothetical protein